MKKLEWIGLLGVLVCIATSCSPYYRDSETGSYLPRDNYFVAAGKQIKYTAPQDGTVYFVSNTGTKRINKGIIIGVYVNEPIKNACSTRQLTAGETVEVNFLDETQANEFGLDTQLPESGTVEVYFIPASRKPQAKTQ